MSNVQYIRYTVLYTSFTALPNLATQFWADVRFVFRNSGSRLGASPRVETATSRQTKAHGSLGTVFQMYTPCRLLTSSHPRNPVMKLGRPAPSRYLATHTATARPPHHRTWEDEALQDMMLSWPQQQGSRVPSSDDDISVRDESLKAASPLRSSVSDCLPRFDWRLRAPSRAHTLSNDRKTSCDGKEAQSYIKRVMPQQVEIQPGERFHNEVRAYEDRWVLLFLSEVTTVLFLLDFYPCWSSSKPKKRRKCAKDWQSGPSSDCAARVIASQGCRHSGWIQSLAKSPPLALVLELHFRITSLSKCFRAMLWCI